MNRKRSLSDIAIGSLVVSILEFVLQLGLSVVLAFVAFIAVMASNTSDYGEMYFGLGASVLSVASTVLPLVVSVVVFVVAKKMINNRYPTDKVKGKAKFAIVFLIIQVVLSVIALGELLVLMIISAITQYLYVLLFVGPLALGSLIGLILAAVSIVNFNSIRKE